MTTNYENDIAHAEAVPGALFHQAFGGTLPIDPAAQAECDAMHAWAMSRAAKGLADLTVPEGRVMMAQELAEGITPPTLAEARAEQAAAWALADQAEQDLARVAPGKNNAGLDA